MESNTPALSKDREISPAVRQAKMRFGIVGNAPALNAAVERAVKVAPIDLSVLVTGESGSGKEFFPQIIHANSSRKHAKYIAVNCGAIPEGTIDSELFGHEKGAFTGAVDSRKGYFEEANGGTIFLDEVAELPLTTQARLLRVLESGEFMKVGSSTVQKTNIRIVAATNVDMLRAIEEGRFREDLFYRLSTVQISIPPLRARGSDIRLLARKFAADFSERYRMPPIEFDDSAIEIMYRYRWPGNVRQLKNVVEQMALFEASTTITDTTLESYLPANGLNYMPATTGSDTLHSYSREREMLFGMIFSLQNRIDELERRSTQDNSGTVQTSAPASGPAAKLFEPHREILDVDDVMATDSTASDHRGTSTALIVSTPPIQVFPSGDDAPVSLEDNEREMIRRALERHSGRRKAAAGELQISERTLYRKIKEYGLE